MRVIFPILGFIVPTKEHYYYVCGKTEEEALEEFKSLVETKIVTFEEVPEEEWDNITVSDYESIHDDPEELTMREILPTAYASLVGTNDEEFF